MPATRKCSRSSWRASSSPSQPSRSTRLRGPDQDEARERNHEHAIGHILRGGMLGTPPREPELPAWKSGCNPPSPRTCRVCMLAASSEGTAAQPRRRCRRGCRRRPPRVSALQRARRPRRNPWHALACRRRPPRFRGRRRVQCSRRCAAPAAAELSTTVQPRASSKGCGGRDAGSSSRGPSWLEFLTGGLDFGSPRLQRAS